MGYATSRIGAAMSSGVATLRTVTSGAPRLASAASIEPCPTSRNVVGAETGERVHGRAPAHRHRRRGGRAGRASRRRRCRPRASSFETTGPRVRPGRARRASGCSPAVASAISGVWNAPPTFSGIARRTPSSLARADAGVDAVGRAGDHDLAGGVVVGDPARVGRGGARVVGLLGRGAEQRGHAARGGRRPRPG